MTKSATNSASADSRERELLAVAEALLRRHNQRLTAGRSELISILAKVRGPITIAEILERRPALAQSSAYRNLVVLESSGIVHRVVTRDGFARYELAENLTGHHHHLVCEACGRVEDLPAAPTLERALDNAVTDARRRLGFMVTEHRLDLFGRCSTCN